MTETQERYHHLVTVNGWLHSLHHHKITPSEFLYIASFLFNFIVGKVLHLFSQKEEVYNYYNDKGNVFNQYFVKKGWGWTTLLITFFYVIKAIPAKASKSSVKGGDRGVSAKSPKYLPVTWSHLLGAAFRYIVATVWWILFTQWCFGVPLMDKVFLLTGGKCGRIPSENVSSFIKGKVLDLNLLKKIDELYESTALSSQQCRRLRGSWEGGHDPLGHVFLLVHSSLYLFFEIKEHWGGLNHLVGDVRLMFRRDQHKLNAVAFIIRNPDVPLILLMSLWWFMLLMTNMYFHLLAEKLVGLAFGYFGIVAMYIVPRWL